MSSTREGYLAYKIQSTPDTGVIPTHFVRFESGDIELNQETVINSPIQNNRARNISALSGKITADGSYEVSCDFNECVVWMYGNYGNISSADVSSATDGSVYEHTITTANDLPTFTFEQGKGNLDDTSNDRQNYIVSRAYGVMVDVMKLSGSDDKIMINNDLKAHGVFQRAKIIEDVSSGSSVAIPVKNDVGALVATDLINIYDTDQAETNTVGSVSASASTVTIATLANSFERLKNAKIELRPLTPSYGTEPLVAMFHDCKFQESDTLTNAASAAETGVEDWEFEHGNNLGERFGSLRPSPSNIDTGDYEDKFSFTRYFTNVTDRDNYLNLTKRAVIFTISNDEVVSEDDTNNHKYTVQIEMPNARYTAYGLPTANSDVYAAKVSVTPLYDSSEGFATRIKVKNAKAGTVYTA